MQIESAGFDGKVQQLRVTGVVSSNVNLQASFDLQSWITLESATTDQGKAEFSRPLSGFAPARYYRAVVTPPPAPVNVGPQEDAGQSVSGVVTPDEGGLLQITDPAGITYQLTVPTLAVTEPVLLKMTVITNFTNLPLENRFRAAVNFEPDGLEFQVPAELKIHYPQPLPMVEMLGYGFDGSGEGLHLQPWDVSAQEVTVPILHFSGVGASAQSFGTSLPASPGPATTYNQATDAAWDAYGRSRRANAERLAEGKISEQQYHESELGARRLGIITIVEDGIMPILDAARNDCKLAQTVLSRLHSLEVSWENTGEPYGSGPAHHIIQDLAPLVRCRCAHQAIEKCENEITASGGDLIRNLLRLFTVAKQANGNMDVQGCDLGDDRMIIERLTQAACFREWEGVFEYRKTTTLDWTINLSPTYKIIKFGKFDWVYTGKITGIANEVFVELEPAAPNEAYWYFSTEGVIVGVYSYNTTTISFNEDYRETTTERIMGEASYPVVSDDSLNLHFLEDPLAFFEMNIGVGLNVPNQFPVKLKRVHTQQIECYSTKPGACPVPLPTTTEDYPSENMYGALGGKRATPTTVFTFLRYSFPTGGELHVTVTKTKDLGGGQLVKETLKADLWRSAP